MTFEYELPDVGEGVAEGEIVAWHVEPGDHVEEDEVLAEVETDKAVVDLPSPVTGTIRELHAEEGEVVAVGSVVVTIDVDGEAADDGVEVASDEEGGAASDGEMVATGEAESGVEGDATVEPAKEPPVAEGRVFAPPNVRRLARELGVDISTVNGSGPSGRITESDVRARAEEMEGKEEGVGEDDSATDDEPTRKQAVTRRSTEDDQTNTVSEPSGAGEAVESADREKTLAVPATRELAAEYGVDIDEVPTQKTRDGKALVEPEDVEAFVETQRAATEAETSPAARAEPATEGVTDEVQPLKREPYRGIRRTIGDQMATSSSTIPHATHHDTAVVSELVETRATLKERADERGISLTYVPFVLKAVVAGLQAHPVMNTELDESAEEIIYKGQYNVGIAVATDAGLMVPVVSDVDQKGILQLASEVNELAERARERKITPEEMQGGTFTITNFGAIGGEYATPIVNHPETAILGLGAIEKRPVVDATGDGDSEVVAKHTLPLSLSIDHRVIDGAEAAAFTNSVIEYLEQPRLLLLE